MAYLSSMPNPTEYPIRINKYLALKNYSTRRGADELIAAGKVLINGRRAVLGDKVEASDKVEVRFRKVKMSYYLYHKPVGVTTDEQPNEKDIKSVLGRKDIFPVGRLDKESHGLILLTNDGRVTDRLLNPDAGHDKEYRVKVDKKVTPFLLRHLEQGVDIEGYKTRPAKADKLTDNIITITISEGKKHQIRRMCVALGFQVRDLERTRIMNLRLGNLAPGELRELKGDELEAFLKELSLL
jgi:23S rRNA pseudouridine2604 synthase